MRGLVSSLLFLLAMMAPVAAQDDPAPAQPRNEDDIRQTDAPHDDQKTEAKPKALAPDIIDTADKASEDLPLIFPADI